MTSALHDSFVLAPLPETGTAPVTTLTTLADGSQVQTLPSKAMKLDTREQMEPFTQVLRERAHDIKQVTLSGHTIGVEAMANLSEAIKELSNLEKLNCSDIFTGRLLTEIPHALKHLVDAIVTAPAPNPRLSAIDLSDNAFGPIGADPLVPLLSSGRLSSLHIANCGLGPQGGSTLLRALATAATVPESRGLVTLVMGRNRLENGSSAELASVFKAHSSTLRHLALPQNGIRPEGCATLLKALQSCHSLEYVDLQDNTFTASAALVLAEAIPHWPQLRHLECGDCMLDARGSFAVLRALVRSAPVELSFLGLQYNSLGPRALRLLVRLIEKCPKLTRITLTGNAFDKNGAEAKSIRALLTERTDESAVDEWTDMEWDSDEDARESEASEEEDDEEGEEPTAAAADLGDELADAMAARLHV